MTKEKKKLSSYEIRIQTKLAELSIGLNPLTIAKFRMNTEGKGGLETTIVGGEEWLPTQFYYYAAKKDQHNKCQLCGHNPIKRVFVIKSQTSGQELHIGSECALNYIEADIVDGLTKMFQIEYNKIVNPIKYEDGVQALEWAVANNILLPRHMRYEFINSGDPQSVLWKIEQGKGISKREKEIMDAYSVIYADPEGYAAVEQIAKDLEAMVYRKRQERWEHERQFERFINLLRFAASDLTKYEEAIERNREALVLLEKVDVEAATYNDRVFVVDEIKRVISRGEVVPAHLITRLNNLIEKQEKHGEYDDLFTQLDALELNDSQKHFVESVRSQYESKNKISDRQKVVLDRFLSGDEEDDNTKELFESLDKCNLNAKDSGFVESVRKQFEERSSISSKQRYVLEKILKRNTN